MPCSSISSSIAPQTHCTKVGLFSKPSLADTVMHLSWLRVGLTWMAETRVRLRHGLKLGCEVAVCRMQLHCTIATSLNTRLTAMCAALCIRPAAKAIVLVLQGVRTGQIRPAVSRDICTCHPACHGRCLYSRPQTQMKTTSQTCWMANADGSAHCLV